MNSEMNKRKALIKAATYPRLTDLADAYLRAARADNKDPLKAHWFVLEGAL
jgi:hypothetical protein